MKNINPNKQKEKISENSFLKSMFSRLVDNPIGQKAHEYWSWAHSQCFWRGLLTKLSNDRIALCLNEN